MMNHKVINFRRRRGWRPARGFTALVIVAAAVFGSGCYADPREEDLERVKEDFLTIRFLAPFREEWRGLDDESLFELSCQQNRVQCDDVRAMLKEEDPEFYAILVGQTDGRARDETSPESPEENPDEASAGEGAKSPEAGDSSQNAQSNRKRAPELREAQS